MASNIYDIITVGGGLGGSSLAWTMAKHGARVLVLERETHFKDRVRGEALIPWGGAEAKTLGLYDLLQETCGQEVPWLDMYIGPTRVVHRDFVATTPHHTPMSTFYHPAAQERVLQAAAESGAAVRRGARVTSVQPGTPATVVVEQDGHTEELHARLIVGADGRTSMVRKWADFAVQRDPERLLVSGQLFETMPIAEDTS